MEFGYELFIFHWILLWLQYTVECSINIDVLQFQKPINPYGKAKKMAEDIIFDFSKNSKMAVMILRFVFYIYIVDFPLF